MARYFFHVMDGRVVIDTTGIELANIWEVRSEAIRRAGAVLSSLDVGLLFGGPWTMTVANEGGNTVFLLKFEASTYGV